MSNPLMNNPYYQNPSVSPIAFQPSARLQYPTPTPTPMPIAQPPEPFTWVDGPVQAEAYRVAAGQTAVLWDSAQGSNRIYIKSTDVNGVPQPMRVLEYNDVTGQQNRQNQSAAGFVTLDEVNELIEQKLNERFNRNKNRKPKPRREESSYEE